MSRQIQFFQRKRNAFGAISPNMWNIPPRELAQSLRNSFIASLMEANFIPRNASFSLENTPRFQFVLKNLSEQVTRIGFNFSDHRTVISELDDGGLLIYLNMMMQGKEKIVNKKSVFNNAFNQKETDVDYQKRIMRVMHTLVRIAKSRPNSKVIALQEAPIRAEDIRVMADIIDFYLPEWHLAYFDMTDFGLMTFIRSGKNENTYYTDYRFAEKLEKLSERFLTMTNGGSSKFSNIHAIHDSDKRKLKTIASLKTILKAVIDDAISSDLELHNIAGDFNLNFAVINAVLKEAWNEKCEELARKNTARSTKLRLEAYFEPSLKGHKKSDGSFVDADGVLSIRFRKVNDKYSYHFKKGKYLISGFVLGVPVVTEGVFDVGTTAEVGMLSIARFKA